VSSSNHRNRLASETSAYLLQHASNPVDWYPWGDEALSLARSLDRPILLSVGYSACHWCHVMERESFENEAIAARMNEEFVCIKVDREERPDVDALYMKALQGMTGRGGWPMTIFLTPDARPFFGGTYFPPEDRSGMAGFPRVLESVAKTWRQRRDDVEESAGRMVEFLERDGVAERSSTARSEAVAAAADSLVAAIDEEYGGFGRAPKFPATMALTLLLETGNVSDPSGSGRSSRLVRLSLDAMAAGGIHDQLGGGFHRYSVDRVWLVPHFEKMLYDQALLARLYVDASRRFGSGRYARVASRIFDYVLREMTDDGGGFFSAQDADSEGEEGRFFVWTEDEITSVLGPERSARFCRAHGVRAGGNFEGRSILHRPLGQPGEQDDFGDQQEAELDADRERLLRARQARVAPATDRKIVADWSSLMLGAMAAASTVLRRPDLLLAATRAAAFIRDRMWPADGLRHVHAGGDAKVPAFLDDYAMFGRACLDLYEAAPDAVHLDAALRCADRLLADFHDDANGGFFFTAAGGETLVARTNDLHDGAVPSGNSVAAELLLRLWSLTGEERYRAAGDRVLERFLGVAERQPYGASQLLVVTARSERGLRVIAVAGEPSVRAALSQAARDVYDPATTVIEIDSAQENALPPALRGKAAPAGEARAYVCQGTTCSLPIGDPQALRDALRSTAA
jgi:uncharacterized protein YyaL (SSP411 family)